MAQDNKLLNDRIEQPDTTPKGLNWPMVGGIAALSGFVLYGVWVNFSGPGDTAREGIIPEVTQTPDPRSQGGALFGAVPTEPLPDTGPLEDPRVAALLAEIAQMRQEMENLKNAPRTTPSEQSGNTETPAPVAAPNNDAEITALNERLLGQEQVMVSLLEDMKAEREAARDRQRELLARLEANRPLTVNTTTGAAADTQSTEDPAVQAEAERLASPIATNLRSSSLNATTDQQASETGNGFLDAAASRPVQTVRAVQLGDVNRLVPQGTTIPAILETAIQSDLPGQLRARVSRDVWSADATTILIPRGSTLVGEYSSDVSLGQSRVLVAWNRVITTDQRSVMIGSRGVDNLGRAGQTGNVQHHFGLKFEAAFFISIFSGVANLGNRTINDGDNNSSSSFVDGTNQFSEAATEPLTEYLSIAPTIWIDQGENINVFVSRDLYL